MPIIKFSSDSPEEKARQELIKSILPEKNLVDDFLQPRLLEAMEDVLIKALKAEIKIYKAYPKTGEYAPGTFEPRNNLNCFMGQGFRHNGTGMEGWTDFELKQYRTAIGTIAHKEWGDCTLMEIWAADHFKDYTEMVKGVFLYCWGDRKTLPNLQFHINPFFKNTKSGTNIIADVQKEGMSYGEHLNKVAAYIEIRDRLKKAKITKPLDLAVEEKDDPKGSTHRRYSDDEDDDD